MIRRLRWKVVGLNMGMVFCVLLAVFAAVFFFARSALSRSVRQQMEEAVRTGVYDLSQPDGSTLPCFVAEVYASGTVRVSGNGYYDLTDKSALADIVTAALSALEDEGVLADYHLRYLRSVGLLSTRIAFTDSTLEQSALRAMAGNLLLIALAALVVLLGCSYLLSGVAARPVERAWQGQQRFLSDASHELKTPLTVILSSAELAASETDGEKSRQYLDNIHAESLRMKDLVEDMLTLARTESGTRLPEEAVDLSDTVLESALAFEPVAFENGKPMEYTVQPELTVSGRSAQLRQVADILLDNAVKYAEPGSPIQMGLRREGRNAVLWVENRSAPIPPEKLGHLFDRFYRVDESRTGGEGFGLGLAIARTIVQSHRGSIGCTSAQGVTRFTVTLPLAKNEVTKRGSEA